MQPYNVKQSLICAALVLASVFSEYENIIKKGQEEGEKGHLFEAVKAFSEAIKLEPSNPEAYYYRSRAFHNTGFFDKALNDINQCLALDKKYPSAMSHRGQIYSLKKQYDRSIADLTAALKFDASDTVSLIYRGDCFKAKKDYQKAMNDFQKAIDIKPDYADAYKELAQILAACPEGRFRDAKKAIELATKACELTSWEDGASLDVLAAACAESGQFDEAIKWQNKAIEKYGLFDIPRITGLDRLELYERHKPLRLE
jgi:tetratricopeptide (TPR) repeat protein